jgi:hypothetical protein
MAKVQVSPVPRVLTFVTIKRNIPRFRDTYGHWWIEVDGLESYGWWADHCPLRIRAILFGSRGMLNGVGGTCPGERPPPTLGTVRTPTSASIPRWSCPRAITRSAPRSETSRSRTVVSGDGHGGGRRSP